MKYRGLVLWEFGTNVAGTPVWGVYELNGTAYLTVVTPELEIVENQGLFLKFEDGNVNLRELENHFNCSILEDIDYLTALKLALNYLENEDLERKEETEFFEALRIKFVDIIE